MTVESTKTSNKLHQ